MESHQVTEVVKDASTKIQVYLDDGRVFEYTVANGTKAREHVYQIAMEGYRRVDKGELEYYPVHRIKKVKAVGDVTTMFPDTAKGS